VGVHSRGGVVCEVGWSAWMVGWSAGVGVGSGRTETKRSRTGGVPRRLGVWMVIRCVLDVWFCCPAVVIALVSRCSRREVYAPPQGASVPESRSLSWSFTLCVLSSLPVRASPVFVAGKSSYGVVVGAWGIDHVPVGSVPPRATGVRPSGACRVRFSISVALGAWCGPAASVFVFGADVAGSVTGVALGGLGVVGSHFFFWCREGGVIFPAFLV